MFKRIFSRLKNSSLAITVAGVVLFGGAILAENQLDYFADPSNCEVAHFDNNEEELGFVFTINNYRAQNGLPSLQISHTLNKAATWMALDMIENQRFDHVDSLGRSPFNRAVDCGLSTGMGENLAAGNAWDTAVEAFNAWKNSPGHNANMLGSFYQSIGVAREQGGPYGWYWVTNFGTQVEQDPLPPLVPTATNTPRPFPTATTTPLSSSTTPPTKVEHTIYLTIGGFNPPICYLDRIDSFRFHNLTAQTQNILPGPSTSEFLKVEGLGPNQISKSFNFPFIGSQQFYMQQNPNLVGRITTDRGRDCDRQDGFPSPAPTLTPTPTVVPPTIPVPTPTPLVSWPTLNGPTLVQWQNDDLRLSRAPFTILGVRAIYHWTGNEWLNWTFGTPAYVKSLEVLEKGKYYWVIPR